MDMQMDLCVASLTNIHLMTEAGPVKQRGRICMDMCMIDIQTSTAQMWGSEIEIFGENNPIETMAEIAGTIPYELVCAVSKRVHRIYIEHGEVVDKELMLRM